MSVILWFLGHIVIGLFVIAVVILGAIALYGMFNSID